MNIFQSISKREKGFKFHQDYDIALARLYCQQQDLYQGISVIDSASEFEPKSPVFACRFASAPGHQDIIALANEDGKIALQDTSIKTTPSFPFGTAQAHNDAIFDIAWMPQEMKLISVSGDHSARLWNVTSSGFDHLETFHAHTRSIKSAVFRYQDKAVFATGGRDGAIMIWDIRAVHSHLPKPKPDNCIYNAHYMNSSGRTPKRRTSIQTPKNETVPSITGLAFQDDYTLLSCSTGDGLIKVWDLRKNYTTYKKDAMPKTTLVYGGKSNNNGFTSLSVCPAGIILYASCMDNTIYAYNIASHYPKPIAEYYGNEISTFYVKTCLSPDGKYIASGSSDGMAYIWHSSRPGIPLLKLSGHREEVTCVSWCSVGDPKIVTCADDSCQRVWRVGNEFLDPDEKVTSCGLAEPIRETIITQKNISATEKTPTTTRSRKRRDHSIDLNLTPGPHHANRSAREYGVSMPTNFHSESNSNILSPVPENHESSCAHSNVDSKARRLFSPADREPLQETDDSRPNGSCASPSLDHELSSFSPTLNLPNFVIDGTAPHLLEISPQKSKENIDWLTKMRKERYACRTDSSVDRSSPKNQCTPVDRKNRSKSNEPRRTPRSSANLLLQFFKPTVRDHKGNVNVQNQHSSSHLITEAE
ncbi:hypothetical protein QAD02_012496 [Eretmocerus hayati]|uniref:Uncharacterized protein n=1 Tax=Eretmocerus hayati TaxID=131215 RepID=A0ACC2P048_9HYME|nr:hypothetical protein QAD02_012496 [Eretmocerus hayati]